MSAARVIGVDVGTSSVKAVAIDEHGARAGRGRRAPTRSRCPTPAGQSRIPRTGSAATEAVLAELGADRADGIGLQRPDARAGRARRRRPPAASGDPVERRPQPAAGDARSNSGSGIERLVALSGNRALAGFTAPKLRVAGRARARGARAASRRDACCPRTTCACGSPASWPPTSPTRRERCCSTSARRRGARSWPRRSRSTRRGCRPSTSRTRSPAARPRGVPVAAGAGDQAAGALGVGVTDAGGPGVAGARHLRRDLRRPGRLRRRSRGPAARVLPRAARPLARDGRDPRRGRRARLAGRRGRPRRRHPGAAGGGGRAGRRASRG